MKKELFIKYFTLAFAVFFGGMMGVYALNCTDWGEAKQDLQNIFNAAKIAVPLLVAGLSSIDFIKAVTGKDSKDMKKAFGKLTKRLILAVIFFFLPMLINLMLDTFMVDSSTCIS